MRSARCDRTKRTPEKALSGMGYLFFDPSSSAALKPCMWCKRALTGGEMCYKHQFYGIDSHRCVQLTPTLRCNHRCLFCWRSFEHEYSGERDLLPQEIISKIPFLQKKGVSGLKVSPKTSPERWNEAIHPNQVAISLSGEPTLYPYLSDLIEMLNENGNTTFLVSNGTNPEELKRCRPFQKYVSLTAPDRETYLKIAQPQEDYWDRLLESLRSLGTVSDQGMRTAIRITLIKGINDYDAAGFARLIQESGASFVEVKSYMHVGYSQKRLTQAHMPLFEEIRTFTQEMLQNCEYSIRGENSLSRVICLEKIGDE
ncbi:MAG TPA: 4-demethylwyosine synthase TYW1 [Methanospirillum sp.]|nr:4-demethylwyosine synthase TYW1 [Methanospirillum sp.]